MARSTLLVGIIALVILLAGGALYGFYSLSTELSSVSRTLAETEARAKETEETLTAQLATKTQENTELSGALRREQQKNGTFESQLNELTGTVGTLEKLAKTDPELLAKYSKVYFLNENYVPTKLAAIDNLFAFQENRTYEVHAEVAPFLDSLLKEAEDEGLSLKVASSYRSFANQAALKSNYTVKYGSGANAFSADQGYSEHQLGTAVDFTTPTVGGTFAGFDKTKEYEWLMDHAWKYGFILSYPKGNTYYQYEPWHWRFVGTKLAEDLHDDKDWFYDLDQRTIDTYLVSLFD